MQITNKQPLTIAFHDQHSRPRTSSWPVINREGDGNGAKEVSDWVLKCVNGTEGEFGK